jgi:hypothetical protein
MLIKYKAYQAHLVLSKVLCSRSPALLTKHFTSCGVLKEGDDGLPHQRLT